MSIYYELNGKTITMSLEEYLDLDDRKIQELIASDRGVDTNDPFMDFRDFNEKKWNQDIPDLPLEELSEDDIKRIKREIDDDEIQNNDRK